MSDKDVAHRCEGPAYKGNDIVEMWHRALDRCGKPVTVQTRYGWRCVDCAKWHKERDEDPHTLINVLRDFRDKRKKSAS